MTSSIPALVEALEANWLPQHSIVARRILAHIDFLDESIATLSDEIVELTTPFRPAVELITTIPGVSQLTAEVVIAEIGVDMGRFPTADHLASWAGLAPGSRESAGKKRPAGTRPGDRHLRVALVEAAKSASRSNGTFLGARYRRVARRRGPNKATIAVAHTILCTIWHLLSTGEPYNDLGADYYEQRRDPARKVPRALADLQAAGYTVTLEPAA